MEVFNIQPIGNIKSIGSFKNGREAIGISEGIVFSSGNLDDIPGPNFSQGATGGHYGQSDAPYLSKVVRGVNFFDAVGIEFDFIPTSDFVSFNYVFASEEYCEYVDSEFNDTFGFFVSGPGIEGDGHNNSINVAKIEQKNDAVTINNVNHKKNNIFFVNNLTRIDAAACEIQESPKNLNAIEFDGFTTKLQAFFSVIPCETYHIRLVVADVSDDILDSAVFLEGKSFDTGAKATIRVQVNNLPDTLIYENCLAGKFIIDRSKLSDRSKPLDIEISVLGTASNGIDFETISDNLILDPMELRRDMPITIFPDDLMEGQEYVEVVVSTTSCDCVERDTAKLYIADSKETLNVFFEDEFVCPRQPFSITPNVPDGIEPLFYTWDTGDTTAFINDEITSPTSYSVTVTDVCGATNNDAVEVQLQAVPTLEIDGNFIWCEGRTPETLLLEFPGQAPWTIDFFIDNQPVERIEKITTNPYPFSFEEVGLYHFEGFSDKHCSGIISGMAEVTDISFGVTSTLNLPSCANANDGQISLNFEGGIAPFSIFWDTMDANTSVLSAIPAGNYGVAVIDQLGCLVNKVFTLPPAAISARCNIDLDKSLYIPNAFSPNGDGINDGFTIFPKFGVIQSISYQIFDRWGGLVYQSSEYSDYGNLDYWDGGKFPMGVYFCMAEVAFSDGSMEHFGSDVTLVF